MNGVVTKLGFTLWAKNLTGRAFNSLHRDLVKTRVLSNQADGSFRRFVRNMNRETRAARGFGTVLATAVIAPLAGAGGVFAGAAAGIASVGTAMAGMMAVGIMAAGKLQKGFDNIKGYKKDLKAIADETMSDFMDRIAPNYFDALDQLKTAMQELSPILADMFNDLAPMTAPFIKSMTDLAKKVMPAIGQVFQDVGPHMTAFVDSFSGLAGLIESVGQSLDRLAPSVNPIIKDIIDVATMILGPNFFGALSPLIDGLHGFFENAKPGFFKFLQDFAVALNNLAPVLPALGTFLSEILIALGPLLITVSESLAENLPGILTALGGFVDFLGEVLDNKAVVDTLLGIAAAYMAISGALKGLNAVMAVTTLLSFGTVPGGGPASGAKGGGAFSLLGAAPKSPTKLSAGWAKWANGVGRLLGGAIRAGILLGVGLWIADEVSTKATGNSIGDDWLGIREKFNATYDDKGFWKSLWDGITDEIFPDFGAGSEGGPVNNKDPNADGRSGNGGFAEGKGIQSNTSAPKWLREWDKAFDDLFNNWGDNLSHLMKNFRQFWINLKKNLDNAWQNMQAWLSRAGENVKTWLGNIGKNISRTVSNVGTWFGNLSKNVSGTVDNIVQFLQNLGTNIRRTWNNVINFLKALFFGIGPWLLQNVVMPVKNFFVKTLPNAFSTFRQRAAYFFGLLRAKLGEGVSWIKRNIIDRMANFFTKTIPNAADSMAKKVRNAFNKAKEWVGEVWAKLGNVVRAPVNWVITNVYNNGIRALWNKVAKAVGASELGKMSTIGGAPKADNRSAAEKTRDLLTAKSMVVGGPVSGGPPGIDTVPAWLNNGEHVLTTEEVRRAGGHGQILKLRSALMGGQPVQGGNMTGQFKDGGFWGKALSFGSNLFSGDWIRGALGAVAEPIMGVIEKGVGGMSDKPAFSGMLKKVALKPLDWIRNWLSKDDEKHSALSDDGSGLYNAMFRWIKARVPGTHLMSGLRAGDWGYHGLGKAVDLGFSDRSEYGPGMRGMAAKAFNLIKSTFKPNIAELIWDFAGSKAVWNGNDHFFTGPSAGPGTHNNHIHWAMARAASGIQPLTGSGGGSGKWAGVVNGVLNELGIDRSNAANVLRAIQKESGGNPRAINNWDSNAAAGIPSKGLLQTIDPTFNAWAGKYKSRGVYDPYANVYAAVRYARNRYGAGWSARMAQPGGYKGGTLSASKGWKMVGENGPEPVYFNGGESVKKAGSSVSGDIHVHVHGNVIGSGTTKEFTNSVVESIKDAQRKGRLPKK